MTLDLECILRLIFILFSKSILFPLRLAMQRSKMSERWLTLARERPPTINEVDIQERSK